MNSHTARDHENSHAAERTGISQETHRTATERWRTSAVDAKEKRRQFVDAWMVRPRDAPAPDDSASGRHRRSRTSATTELATDEESG
jgi:hypothetical protein